MASFVTKVLGVRLDRAALERITTSSAVRGAIRSVAVAVGSEAVRTVGTFQGEQAEAVVFDDVITTGDDNALARRRVAVMVKHPTRLGRQAAALALLMAIDR